MTAFFYNTSSEKVDEDGKSEEDSLNNGDERAMEIRVTAKTTAYSPTENASISNLQSTDLQTTDSQTEKVPPELRSVTNSITWLHIESSMHGL